MQRKLRRHAGNSKTQASSVETTMASSLSFALAARDGEVICTSVKLESDNQRSSANRIEVVAVSPLSGR